MRRIPVLFAIGLSVWSAVNAAGQTPASAILSATLRSHLKSDRFDVVTSVRGLPLGVRDELQTLFGTRTLDIAESWGEFQASGATADPTLPTRRLIAAGCSLDHCFVHYERGGGTRALLVAVFHWTPDETRLEFAGHPRGRLASLDEVRSAVLSGAVKGPVAVW